MEEQLISFETAKLAKEKGFNIATFYGYNSKGLIQEYFTHASYAPGEPEIRLHEFLNIWEYQAPTQFLLQKWLRTTHNHFITVIKESHNEYFCEEYDELLGGMVLFLVTDYETYEDALEAGLYEALKLIK